MGIIIEKPDHFTNNKSKVSTVISRFLIRNKKPSNIFTLGVKKRIMDIISTKKGINSISNLSSLLLSKHYKPKNYINNGNIYYSLYFKDEQNKKENHTYYISENRTFKEKAYDELSLQEYLNKEIKQMKRCKSEKTFNTNRNITFPSKNPIVIHSTLANTINNFYNKTIKVDNINQNVLIKSSSTGSIFSKTTNKSSTKHSQYFSKNSAINKTHYLSFRKSSTKESYSKNMNISNRASPINKNKTILKFTKKTYKGLSPNSSKASLLSKPKTANTSRNTSSPLICRIYKIKIDLREIIKDNEIYDAQKNQNERRSIDRLILESQYDKNGNIITF